MTIHPSHDRLHCRSEVNNYAIEKYTPLQEEKQKAAEEALSKGQDLSSRRKSHKDTELLLLRRWRSCLPDEYARPRERARKRRESIVAYSPIDALGTENQLPFRSRSSTIGVHQPLIHWARSRRRQRSATFSAKRARFRTFKTNLGNQS
ncbi:hypothetical protein CY35_08G027400 [Sphagnum magellanicum]|nr:hypothetical protein CY35_08G027400 [Sphagnum magellanicum]